MSDFTFGRDYSRDYWSGLANRVDTWIRTHLPIQQLGRRQRAMRVFEEAAELLQSEGISLELALKQVQHVYNRPAGNSVQEVGGIVVCLLGWCNTANYHLQDITEAELERIEQRSHEDVQHSLQRKANEGLLL